MRLVDYLEARDESQEAFAKRASRHEPTGRGISQRTVSRIAAGGSCNATTALAIIRATRQEPAPDGGTVMLEDLAVADGDESEGAAA